MILLRPIQNLKRIPLAAAIANDNPQRMAFGAHFRCKFALFGAMSASASSRRMGSAGSGVAVGTGEF